MQDGSDPESERRRVWELMKELDVCMLVTSGRNGLSARPMSTVVDVERAELYIITEASSTTAAEIGVNPDVLLAFSTGSTKNLSVVGSARVTADRDLLHRIWNTGAQAFWPEGPDNSNVVALDITPYSAEYWIGSSSPVAGVKFLFALATKTEPELGRNIKVAL